jgi:MYXO-CTERM domain-containing protein
MNKPTVASRWLPVLALVAVAAPTTAFAETITGSACAPGSFASYEVLDGGCNVTDANNEGLQLQLLNFRLTSSDPNLNLTTIFVNPVLINGTLNIGFTGFPGVAQNQTTNYELDYTIDPPPVLDDMSAQFDPFGNITGSVTYCGDPIPGSTNVGGCTEGGSFGFGVTNGVAFPGSVTLANPVSTLVTQTFFTLNPGGDTASGFDALNYTVGTVGATPEPGAWLLAAGGLGLLAFRRKQHRG